MIWSSITGWPCKVRQVSALVPAVVLLATIVIAAPPQEESQPDMDFLEFLGSWQTRDGQWVDPMQVEDLPPGELEVERDSRDRGKRPTSLGKDRNPSDATTSEPSPSPNDDLRPRRRDR